MLIDTHTHLYLETFGDQTLDVIQNAIGQGVGLMILPAIREEYIGAQKKLLNAFPDNIKIASGLHPSDVKENFEIELDIVKRELETGMYVAVGECGIDLYWDKTHIEAQKSAFIRQIEFAKQFDLPLIIHARDAFSEIFDILDSHADEALRGVFHSFTGGSPEIEKILEYKTFSFGINGIVTFKNSGLDKAVAQIPIHKLLMETDAPFLAPVPHRGKRNESAFLIHIAHKIAQILNVSLSEIEDLTTHNAKQLFRLK